MERKGRCHKGAVENSGGRSWLCTASVKVEKTYNVYAVNEAVLTERRWGFMLSVGLPVIQFLTYCAVTWVAWMATVQPIKGKRHARRRTWYGFVIWASFFIGLITTFIAGLHSSDIGEQLDEVMAATNSYLLPGDEPMPSVESLGCHRKLERDSYVIIAGRYVNVVKKFPISPFTLDVPVQNPITNSPPGIMAVSPTNVFTVNKMGSGLLALTMDIRNKDGNALVEFDKDGFYVNPSFGIKRHPNKSTLSVSDLKNKEILKVVYANKRLLRIDANVDGDGGFLANTEQLPTACIEGEAEGMQFEIVPSASGPKVFAVPQ